MENFEEKTCLCALNRIFGFEPKIGLQLLSLLGSARAVFDLNENDWNQITGPHFKYKERILSKDLEAEARELNRLASEGITFCGWTEEHYPTLLKECEDPPVGLYIRSSTPLHELWKPFRKIAVVGTRDISPYGKEWCERIVKALAGTDCRPAIISGLALGTDITAHKTAINEGLPTIGVMATGPEEVYPYRHRDFARKLVETPGCALISDYPPGTAPVALNFLRRNRIIAGLSDATVLVESKIKGGGMMTCRLAFSYSRDVYALPGRADDLRSQGCNELIRSKIAEPVTSERVLLDSLGLTCVRKAGSAGLEQRLISTYEDCTTPERLATMSAILKAIRSNRGITVDELTSAVGTDIKTISEMTGILEVDGFIYIDLLKRCSINYKNV